MRKREILLATILSAIFCVIFIVGVSQLSQGVMYDNVSDLPNPYSYSENYAVAQDGYVFVAKNGYYYLKVTEPEKYDYIPKADADKSGYILNPNSESYTTGF